MAVLMVETVRLAKDQYSTIPDVQCKTLGVETDIRFRIDELLRENHLIIFFPKEMYI